MGSPGLTHWSSWKFLDIVDQELSANHFSGLPASPNVQAVTGDTKPIFFRPSSAT
jgi:hypothetical protein